MLRPIHPFPARMAPQLAIAALRRIPSESKVLDPMMGSGTVLRQATYLGHHAIGFDLDPLAVLMSKVWTTPVCEHSVDKLLAEVIELAKCDARDIYLSWIDDDKETKAFIDFWFAAPQQRDLRRLAYALFLIGRKKKPKLLAAANLLRVALSRLIITKDVGASLARDVSHSRPHKVSSSSDFEVFPAFHRSVQYVLRILKDAPPNNKAKVKQGDARSLKWVRDGSVDLVLTSPPYLNAIDYMRGHRLALVWLGYSLSELRSIRSSSIGAERAPDAEISEELLSSIGSSMGDIDRLPSRYTGMINRYIGDSYYMMSEIFRVLHQEGKAVLVVGNSCLNGVFINNSNAVVKAAYEVGLKLTTKNERELPDVRRYLPMPSKNGVALGKRMRTETVLHFKVA